MIIGFSYDLKDDYLKEGFSKEQTAEFDSSVTVDSVENALKSLGHEVDRIGNLFSLMRRLLNGDRWDLVFNIAEGMYGSGREALVPALLDAYRIPYTFSDPLVHAVTLDKAATKRILRDNGLPVTDFVIVSDPASIKLPDGKYPYFVKPVGEGTGKGITPRSIVHSYQELSAQCAELISVFNQPVIVEPFLSGREATAGVLGTDTDAYCLGVMEIGFNDKSDAKIHSYFNKENCEFAVEYTLAKGNFADICAKTSVAAHKAIGIKDACRVDMRADADGNIYIMEINSLPGLMPARSDLILLSGMAGYTYQQVISEIVDSAEKRWFKK
ncbi:MAG: D-alanine--D-alanine ligase [Deferribacteraceae bacterium]|jgi:D-alanine-D-alanine ligase|nr:D-alanine--D-alanine ligase [Deferribacteraceae bacterium]